MAGPLAAPRTAEGFPELARERGAPYRALRATLRFMRQKPLAAFGGVTLTILLTLSLLAPLIAPGDPYLGNFREGLQSPNADHFFGTDDLGRDQLSRVLYGGRYSLSIGLSAVVVAVTIAAAIGLISGYIGSVLDVVVQRFVDAFMSVPFLLLLLTLMSVLGPSIQNVVIVIGVFLGITYSRVIRGAVIGVKAEPYVDAARAIGASQTRIIVLHVLPNVMAPLIILASLGLGSAIIAESSLSFLGFGVPPPEPTWGQMIGLQARPYLIKAPWMGIIPGAAIALAVFSINMLGDGLRDVLDPRLRGGR